MNQWFNIKNGKFALQLYTQYKPTNSDTGEMKWRLPCEEREGKIYKAW